VVALQHTGARAAAGHHEAAAAAADNIKIIQFLLPDTVTLGLYFHKQVRGQLLDIKQQQRLLPTISGLL
jgi:hypothetical protein